jgi:hypothetical protein
VDNKARGFAGRGDEKNLLPVPSDFKYSEVDEILGKNLFATAIDFKLAVIFLYYESNEILNEYFANNIVHIDNLTGSEIYVCTFGEVRKDVDLIAERWGKRLGLRENKEIECVIKKKYSENEILQIADMFNIKRSSIPCCIIGCPGVDKIKIIKIPLLITSDEIECLFSEIACIAEKGISDSNKLRRMSQIANVIKKCNHDGKRLYNNAIQVVTISSSLVSIIDAVFRVIR